MLMYFYMCASEPRMKLTLPRVDSDGVSQSFSQWVSELVKIRLYMRKKWETMNLKFPLFEFDGHDLGL